MLQFASDTPEQVSMKGYTLGYSARKAAGRTRTATQQMARRALAREDERKEGMIPADSIISEAKKIRKICNGHNFFQIFLVLFGPWLLEFEAVDRRVERLFIP